MKQTPLKFHRYSEMFRTLTENENKALESNMLAHGLQTPIDTYHGEILDGRHRYNICIKHGIEIKTKEFLGSDYEAMVYVVNQNLPFRNLSKGQAAVSALPLYDELAKIKKSEASKKARNGIRGPTDPKEMKAALTAHSISKMFNIGRNTMIQICTIRKHRPDLLQKIANGEMMVSRAIRMLPCIRPVHSAKMIEKHREDRIQVGSERKSDKAIKMDQGDKIAREIIAAHEASETVEITLIDSYEKFMQAMRVLNDLGYNIQCVWSNRKVFFQVVKDTQTFISWRNAPNDTDFKRVACYQMKGIFESASKIRAVA